VIGHEWRATVFADCRCVAGGGQHKPGLIYLNPTLQNPTAITMPEYRRKRLASIAKRCNVRIVDDDPYRR
jgi:DNA-binding transcriptional MocR family regulator